MQRTIYVREQDQLASGRLPCQTLARSPEIAQYSSVAESYNIKTFLVMLKDSQIFINSVIPETFWCVPEFENLIKIH